MLSLYLVRHGQTDASLHNRFCGRIDPPLNATGLAMAEALGARYGAASVRRDRRQPACARAADRRADGDAAPGCPSPSTRGCVEIAYGEWDGRPEADVEREDGARFHAWSAHPGRVAPPGGESGADIATRALAAVERIRAAPPDGGKVLVVSHKATLRVLVCALLGIDVDLLPLAHRAEGVRRLDRRLQVDRPAPAGARRHLASAARRCSPATALVKRLDRRAARRRPPTSWSPAGPTASRRSSPAPAIVGAIAGARADAAGLVLPTALMVGELAATLPEEGGYYAWVRRALGPFWGFQEAWLSLVASVFDMAIYPTLFTLYLGRLWPGARRRPPPARTSARR